MPHGARFRKSANLILRSWLTYSQLFAILHLRNLQLGQGMRAFRLKKNVFLSVIHYYLFYDGV